MQLCGCVSYFVVAGKLILYKYLTVTIAITTRKKSSSRLSGGCAIIITTGKKSSSRLSGGCAIAIMTEKKKSSCLSGGCAIAIMTGKKSSRLSGGCAITTISTTGPIYAKSSNFYAKLNVSNLNVTNLF